MEGKMTNTNVVRRFGKPTIVALARELGLAVDPSQSAVGMVESIRAALDANLPDEMSEELFDLCVAWGYIDEDGNVIFPDEATDEIKEEVERPDCYGYCDMKDPACYRCKISTECMQERVKARPDCFGKYYDKASEECKQCIEALDCSQV